MQLKECLAAGTWAWSAGDRVEVRTPAGWCQAHVAGAVGNRLVVQWLEGARTGRLGWILACDVRVHRADDSPTDVDALLSRAG